MKINYGLHHVDDKDIYFVKKSLKNNYLTQGHLVKKFERKLKDIFGGKYCLAVSSGTAALHLVGMISEWNKKDKIICSPNTFVASSNSIIYSNATPIFADIKNDNYNLDPNLCEDILKKKRIKAIIVTDYAGHPADWEDFFYLKKKYNIQLINDNCHAIGSKFKNKLNYAIKFADFVTMSFHPVKNITTGEGGAILLNDKKLFNKALQLRSHSINRDNFLQKKKGMWYYDIKDLGFNYRLTEFQSALGISQLDKLKKFIKKRNQIARIYDTEFMNIKNITIPKKNKNIEHSYHLYPLLINFKKFRKNKIDFFEYMKKNNINLQVHYIPIHFNKYYQKKFNLKKKHVSYM